MKYRYHIITTLVFGLAMAARADDSLIARTFIPSSNNVHGEVRLLKRGDGCCVQTLLYSKFLRRGLFELEKKEREAWPGNFVCHDASTNYLGCLKTARDQVLDAPGSADSNRVYRMMIEFEQRPDFAGFSVYALDLEGEPEQLRVVNPVRISGSEAHPFYISRAMQIMAIQSFAAEATNLLQQAGWQAVPTPELPDYLKPVPLGP